MSECVVRMEMPGCCDACPCLDDYGDYPRCRISEEQRGYNFPIREKRMPNCPIICQLPEGHGRLVDASWKIYIMQVPVTVDDASWIVHALPTIVPAERSET
jgi:hypothetical protein